MTRIPYAEEGQEAKGATPVYEKLKGEFKMVPNLVKLVGHSGPATEVMGILLDTYYNKLSLDPKIREVAYLTATHYNKCPYCTVHHSAAGKRAGLTNEQISLTSEEGLSSEVFSEKEKAVIRYSWETTRDVSASDEAIEGLKKNFSLEEISEIAFTVSMANFIQRIGKNFGAEVEM
ncbi:MAG: hypothetical protein CO184_01310 [Candidatus Zambryskibacteria bacterium CG_4_9_14_3_um_filter_40_16]|uniref:Carboxymuconolactone decarboxylase-like domain-containing protein n=2 Tax=Candidatus Zambryskiibacteriota TaxID=1817925 RepID=A0A2H0K6C7_9BACT|nr:MAG: hypothetical protein COV95_02155 [Candidatus Zambryskibacteria bacterium CG11_big_fil_rev_8_21_14_0_20_40_24]PJA33653.1 MAG: hypothetical protein CO184_01310 [Candidatus Zambryskibacteria bacterium CG_4_9_14_3_um_filter_40_16]